MQGEHAFQFIEQVIKENKLHRPKFWAGELGGEQTITVVMPETATNLRITRETPEANRYRLSIDASKADVTNKAAYEQAFRELSGINQRVQTLHRDGRMEAKDVSRAMGIIRSMACNREAVGVGS